MLSVFGSLFMVESDVKDDFLLKNKVLLFKNVIFVYKGKQAGAELCQAQVELC